jgi:ribonuclease PH
MSIKSKPKMINLPMQDMDALKVRLSTGSPLAEADRTIILSILNVYQWIYAQLESTKLTLHRLTKMLGFNTEKKKTASNKKGSKGKESSTTLGEDETQLPQLPEQGLIIDGENPAVKKS